jgi:nucleotide-binding universal stress UspA family protein
MTQFPRRMLVPLDGSPLAEVALSEALTLAMIPSSEVFLLQVVPPSEDLASSGDRGRIDGETRRATALQYLNDICSGPAWEGIKTRVAVEEGRPAETILDFADHNDIERIVMATMDERDWEDGSLAVSPTRYSARPVEPLSWCTRADLQSHDRGSKCQLTRPHDGCLSEKAFFLVASLATTMSPCAGPVVLVLDGVTDHLPTQRGSRRGTLSREPAMK